MQVSPLYLLVLFSYSSVLFLIKIEPLITSLSTMHSFVMESILDQLVKFIYLFLVEFTDIHNIAGNRKYPCVDCFDKVSFNANAFMLLFISSFTLLQIKSVLICVACSYPRN